MVPKKVEQINDHLFIDTYSVCIVKILVLLLLNRSDSELLLFVLIVLIVHNVFYFFKYLIAFRTWPLVSGCSIVSVNFILFINR